MRSTDHDQPYSPAEAPAALRVPQPRTPPTPEHLPRVEGTGEHEHEPITLARIRESAARNATAARSFGQGRHDEALLLFEQALTSCRALLGADHPDTMTVAGNLAVTHLLAGNRRKGMKLIATAVSARARVLGDEHPMTLVARNALVAAHRMAGDADTAVGLAKQVVVQRSRVLGATHADTLSSRMELALSLAAAGDVSSALRVIASTVSDAEEALGPQHPHTAALLECGVSHGLIHNEA